MNVFRTASCRAARAAVPALSSNRALSSILIASTCLLAPPLLAQQAGMWDLRCSDYHQESRAYVAQAKQALYTALAALPGVQAYEPAVNYILLDIKQTGLNSGQWRERLKRQGILVRDCANYVGLGDSYIRVAVRRQVENERLVDALAAELIK